MRDFPGNGGRRTKLKQYHTIIIGGGPSGMAAALRCTADGQRVLLLDRCDKIGKKILVTGNGKCNLTNVFQSKECYRSECGVRVEEIFRRFGYEETMELFRSVGIYTRNKNGYIYPYNEQASGVREAFALALENKLGLEIMSEADVKQTRRTKQGFQVRVRVEGREQSFACHSLIVATGGLAGVKLGCDGSGYELARGFGHGIVRPLPSLTALKSSAPFLKKISGVRNQGKITLKIEGKLVAQESGELQWTDYGISGVAVFQVSRFAVRAVEEKKEVELFVDFMPEMEQKTLENHLKELAERCHYKTSVELLNTLVPAKLSPVLLREARIRADQPAGEWKHKEIGDLARCLKGFSLRINGYAGYEKAQVTQGGVPLSELSTALESCREPGLFFAGEVVDVDGICGGYNLQWAFASGSVAGQAALERNRQAKDMNQQGDFRKRERKKQL